MRKILNRSSVVVFTLLLVSLIVVGRATSEEGGVRRYGVIYNIAQDRQVIKVGGKYEPEGIDIYMKRLFDDMAQRFSDVESRVGQLEAKIEKLSSAIKSMPRTSEQGQARII